MSKLLILGRATAGLSLATFVIGCVQLPEDAQVPERMDASLSDALWLDAGKQRPPTGAAYLGPECTPSQAALPERDGAVVVRNGSEAVEEDRVRASGDGSVPSIVAAGDLLITELMANPVVIDDTSGEWVELHNPRAQGRVMLAGCAIDDGGRTLRPLDSLAAIEPGGYRVIARSADAGFSPDLVMSLSLGNDGDTVAVLCGGVEIDRVHYGGALPAVAGESLSRDVDGRWCGGVSSYGDNLGTPGRPNPPCGPVADEDGGL